MASRYDGRGDAPTITRRRHVLACARCRARRVKCDRAQPACSNCIKVGALCQPVQQSGPTGGTTPPRPGSREPVERSRLMKLEEQVARLSREVDSKSPSREPSYSPPPHDSGSLRLNTNFGKLVAGRAPGYLSPYSWAVAAEEMLPSEAIVAQGNIEPHVEESLGSATEETLNLIDDRLHETLLEAFSHRVDPIVRILHWPSFQEKCTLFRRNRHTKMQISREPSYTGAFVQDPQFASTQTSPFPDSAISTLHSPQLGSNKPIFTSSDRAFGTLLCSVYYASIISIVHGPNPSDLAQSINAVGLWSALRREMTSRLNIMDESFVQAASVEFLQAMVLYLSVELGTVNPQRQWLQLGTTIHMAQSLGIHRDPSSFGLGPIEIETRRRLWAQICVLDGRLAEQLCREPAINPDTYDISLPLSLTDQYLGELDLESRSMHQSSDMITRFQEMENAQEHAVPFSPMTLVIVEAETARQQQQLLCLRYNPRDRPFRNSPTSPSTRRAVPFSGRTDRAQWASDFQNRLSTRYHWDRFESSDPIQYLAAETCQINLLKIKLMGTMTQRREMADPSAYGDAEVMSTFHEALHLASRCASLTHQYANSPYNWYTRRIRDGYSCSFLAMVLASEQQLKAEDTNAAWSVLDQLFPVDASQRPMEPGMRETLLEKIVAKARIKKELRIHIPVGSHLGEQTLHPPSGVYPQMPPATSNYEPRTPYQTSGNIFEDWDALVQDQIWPGSLPGDNNYWTSRQFSHTSSHSSNRDTSHAQSQPFEQSSMRYHSLPSTPHITTTIVLDPQLHPKLPNSAISSRDTSPLTHSLGSMGLASPGVSPAGHWPQTAHQRSPTSAPSPQALQTSTFQVQNAQQQSRTQTWPTPQIQLQVPTNIGGGRERSVSQPPYPHQPLSPNPSAGGQKKRRSASNLGSRPEVAEITFLTNVA